MPNFVAARVVRIELPATAGAQRINRATDKLPNLAFEGDAAYRFAFGAAHRDMMRADRDGQLLRDGAVRMGIGLGPVE